MDRFVISSTSPVPACSSVALRSRQEGEESCSERYREAFRGYAMAGEYEYDSYVLLSRTQFEGSEACARPIIEALRRCDEDPPVPEA